MAEGTQEPNAGATGNGGSTGGSAGDGRDNFTRQDWERLIQSESDRRVTEALKKREDEYKALLADKDKTADEKLRTYEAQLSDERTRADFMAEAITAGITDPRAAFAVVKEYKLADQKGRINFEELKKAHPALFASAQNPRSVAGATGDNGTGGKVNMTALLRAAARKGNLNGDV